MLRGLLCGAAFLASVAVGGLWATLPGAREPREECISRPATDAWREGSRRLALDKTAWLFQERAKIYGIGPRVRRHLDAFNYGIVHELILGQMYPGQTSDEFRLGVGARFREVDLVYQVRDALAVPDCVADRMVPDSDADGPLAAEQKLIELLDRLSRPSSPG